MRSETKDKIAELATELVQQVGYPSLSYQQISSQLGMKNAAVHYHFPSKEDLGLDVVRRDHELFTKFTTSLEGQSAEEKLDAFLTSYQQLLENGNRICMIGASASDYKQLPDSIRQEATTYLSEVKDWFTRLLENGKADGVFQYKGSAAGKAALITSALAGALQHARLIGNDHYLAVVAQLKLELKP
ncbi:TetR/AcrR family transcriptional regulator [Dyadobacter sp. CY261]|uniref:TetR/AcrR family transcriptional regulator n=1 Tax=Dyadobacter sp. CY261 TaxID=2907203 RepID=UPI001F355C01|nr:TetR/AcrR family transcriptional regulator [Dyadobacter sp. CY261]MCF0074746.1 TetR/AcrR family transcriptional regulator [Dyadobacter sp. CY261]